MQYQIDNLLKEHGATPRMTTPINGRWVAARPKDWQGIIKWKYRIKEAWKVLKGEADILTWYKQ